MMSSGPQVDVPVGGSGVAGGSSSGQNGPGWQGLTIKEILEKVDLFNITVDDDEGADNVKREKVLVGGKQVKNEKVREHYGLISVMNLILKK